VLVDGSVFGGESSFDFPLLPARGPPGGADGDAAPSEVAGTVTEPPPVHPVQAFTRRGGSVSYGSRVTTYRAKRFLLQL